LKGHPGAQLVDVRTAEEYAQGHLAGSKLVPVQELEGRLGELDKGRPTLLYCRSGRRSQQAFDILKGAGFRDLHNIPGGIEAWKAAGLPWEKGPSSGAK
jgi:rhodanese-related sulfurtransferase